MFLKTFLSSFIHQFLLSIYSVPVTVGVGKTEQTIEVPDLIQLMV